jgi:hypothetical protein
MSIKTEILTAIPKEMPFPKLMIDEDGLVVLFSGEGKSGTVIQGDGKYKIGDYRNGWRISSFKDFTNKIVLQNE